MRQAGREDLASRGGDEEEAGGDMVSEQQQEALERALRRARANGLSIVGEGHWRQGGARFLVVGSASEEGRFHLVTILAGRLVCDCPSRALCQHRALAHEALVEEAARRQDQPVDMYDSELAMIQLEAQAIADAALPPSRSERDRRWRERDTAPLYRSNAGFSLWRAS